MIMDKLHRTIYLRLVARDSKQQFDYGNAMSFLCYKSNVIGML